MSNVTALWFLLFFIVTVTLGLEAAHGPMAILCAVAGIVWCMAWWQVAKWRAVIDARDAAREELNRRLDEGRDRINELVALAVELGQEEFERLHGEEFAKATKDLSDSLTAAAMNLMDTYKP